MQCSKLICFFLIGKLQDGVLPRWNSAGIIRVIHYRNLNKHRGINNVLWNSSIHLERERLTQCKSTLVWTIKCRWSRRCSNVAAMSTCFTPEQSDNKHHLYNDDEQSITGETCTKTQIIIVAGMIFRLGKQKLNDFSVGKQKLVKNNQGNQIQSITLCSMHSS